MDDHYAAKNGVRNLPDSIRHLNKRVEGPTADMAIMGGRGISLSVEGISDRLERMLEKVNEAYRTRLGPHRGLEAGIILHLPGGTEVYLDGALRCRETMMRDNPGPRAVLNALKRLAAGYGRDCRHLEADIALKRGQLADYESRLGNPFELADYASRLADLRDKLKLGVSVNPTEGVESVAELAEKIKALRASVAIDAAPERVETRKAVRAERPVTSRIRERLAEVPRAEQDSAVRSEFGRPVDMAHAGQEGAGHAAQSIGTETGPEGPPSSAISTPPASLPGGDYRQVIARSRRRNEEQMRMF